MFAFFSRQQSKDNEFKPERKCYSTGETAGSFEGAPHPHLRCIWNLDPDPLLRPQPADSGAHKAPLHFHFFSSCCLYPTLILATDKTKDSFMLLHANYIGNGFLVVFSFICYVF